MADAVFSFPLFDFPYLICTFAGNNICYWKKLLGTRNLMERLIVLEDVDLLTFYGVKNLHLQMLKALYPKLRMVARGNVMKVIGDELEVCAFEEVVERLRRHCVHYNSLNESALLDIVKRGQWNGQREDGSHDEAICYSVGGKPIVARSDNQRLLIEAFGENDLVFAEGPAGSGKTYLSIALAVQALKNKEVRRIILCRPAVEAGEKLGFLPGDMREKIDPYLQPLYDALEDMVPSGKLAEYMEQGVVQIAPLAFMRGRTLGDAVVILDEAQNTTTAQMKMFLTRMGPNSKMIVTGDLTQVDLPRSVNSGLREALSVLESVQGIGFVKMTECDIVRHKLVTRIVKAWEKNHSRLQPPPRLYPEGMSE